MAASQPNLAPDNGNLNAYGATAKNQLPESETKNDGDEMQYPPASQLAHSQYFPLTKAQTKTVTHVHDNTRANDRPFSQTRW